MGSEITVVGGAGHVGLPLSIMFASKGKKVTVFDIDDRALGTIQSGQMPFKEPGAEALLQAALLQGNLKVSSDPQSISKSEIVIMIIGTPVDGHMNPNAKELLEVTKNYMPYLRDGQLLVLRSTVFPGVTRQVAHLFEEAKIKIDVAFCPERIAEHQAISELTSLPQIVSGLSQEAVSRSTELFNSLTSVIAAESPEEAELAKLFTNTWRYIKFAAANQFYMMSSAAGLDFESIRRIVRHEYPRAADLPSAGLAAGPCLLKDTMQLSAFMDNNFQLGSSAISVNEGLPLFMVRRLERDFPLGSLKVGVLGMSFKADSDDIRSSLSYKLKKILEFRAKEVLTTDPFVSSVLDTELYPLEKVVGDSDLLIIATPHNAYFELGTSKPIFDIWGVNSDSAVFR